MYARVNALISVPDADLLIVGAGFVPAAFGPIATELKVTKQQASYLTTVYTLLGGVTPLLITPFANLYGRRPMYIVRANTRTRWPVTDYQI